MVWQLGFRALLLGNSLLWAGHGNMLVLFKSSCRAGPRLFRLLWIFPSCPPFLKGNTGVYCGHRPCLQGLNFSSRENSSCLFAEACCCDLSRLLGRGSLWRQVLPFQSAHLLSRTRGLDEAERDLGWNQDFWGV